MAELLITFIMAVVWYFSYKKIAKRQEEHFDAVAKDGKRYFADLTKWAEEHVEQPQRKTTMYNISGKTKREIMAEIIEQKRKFLADPVGYTKERGE